MQGVFPVLCFIAGFALAWLVFRVRQQHQPIVRIEPGVLYTRNAQH